MASADDLADRYVDGLSVDWRGLGAALVGGALTVYVVFVVELLTTVGRWIAALPVRLGAWFDSYMALFFELGSGPIQAAWQSAGAFYAPLGPLAYPLVLVQVFVTLWILSRVVPYV